MKKIAIVTSGYLPVPNALGGAVESLDTMLLQENESNPAFDFTVFSCWDNRAEEMSQGFVHSLFHFIHFPKLIHLLDLLIYFSAKYIFRKKKLMSYRYIAQRLFYIRNVAKVLHQTNYDALILENHATLFMVLKHFNNRKKYAGKVYYHLHNEVTNDFGCKAEILSAKKILGVSNFILDTLEKSVGTLRENQKAVWKNCVDTDRFNPDNSATQKAGNDWRNKLKIEEDETVFLFSGRLCEEKGAKELLSAFIEVNKQLPKTRLVIAGAFFFDSNILSSFELQLRNLAEQVNNKIVFTGFVEYEDMPALYAMADICCLPSIWNDPAPLAVIETIASGRALITTQSGGIPEYAEKQGSIILNRDDHLEQNLSKYMFKLASNPALTSRMGKVNRKTGKTLSKYFFLQQLTNLIL